MTVTPVLEWSPLGVSISKREKCTLSKTGCRADFLMWLPKGIEEKSFEARKIGVEVAKLPYRGKARILTKIAHSELFFYTIAWFGALESK